MAGDRPVVPRSRMGEWAYRVLWISVVALPAVITLLRWGLIGKGIVWWLWLVVGIAATFALQVIMAGLAWVYRQRQWRHWLGPVAAIFSFVYYGLWLLLALSLPDGDPATRYESPIGRLLGSNVDEFAVALMWLVGATYLGTLISIIVEGERAVASDPSGRSVGTIIRGLFTR